MTADRDSEVADSSVPSNPDSPAPVPGPWGQEARDAVTYVRGIVRIDINARKQTHGWQARVYLGKTSRSRFFSDSKFGGNAGAHAAAVAALEQMEAGYKKPSRD